LGTWFVAVRQFSGEVKSSAAEQLWTESRSIREWSADRIAEMTGTIAALEQRIQAVESSKQALEAENRELLREVGNLREQLATSTTATESLVWQLTVAQDRIKELEAEIAEIEKAEQQKGN
jgi:chromosome segregation ATPase